MSEHDIFLAAVEISDGSQRVAYLNQACAGNTELRKAVEGLLAAHERSGEFLDVPVLQQMSTDAHKEEASVHSASVDEIDLSFLEASSVGSPGRLMHFEIREVIGQGGCGIVLKAFDQKLERIVAIKVMSPELASTSPARKRFLREARATAAVRHENVINIYAVEEKPLPFLVMEYIDGETLQQRLDRTGPLDVQEVIRIGRKITSGLSAAHACGLIHRDIKPSNVLIERGSNQVKITDFGLARSADDASLTQSGVITGTPMYMSPEQAQGRDLDKRSDLFSLGSVLYAMCSGRPPFRAPTMLAVLKRVVEDQPRPIQNVIPEVPSWFIKIICKLHEKNPEDRFESAEEVEKVLTQCVANLERDGHVELEDVLQQTEPPDQIKTIIDPLLKSGERTHSKSGKTAELLKHRPGTLAVVGIVVLLTSIGMFEVTGITRLHGFFTHTISSQRGSVANDEEKSGVLLEKAKENERGDLPATKSSFREKELNSADSAETFHQLAEEQVSGNKLEKDFRKSEESYKSLWPSLSKLLYRREYSSAEALVDSALSNPKLQVESQQIEADRKVIVGLQRLEQIVLEQAAQLPVGKHLYILGVRNSFVRFEKAGSDNVLVLKEPGSEKERKIPVSNLSTEIWMELAKSRLEELENPDFVLGVFSGFTDIPDPEMARRFLNQAAGKGVDVTPWLARLVEQSASSSNHLKRSN